MTPRLKHRIELLGYAVHYALSNGSRAVIADVDVLNAVLLDRDALLTACKLTLERQTMSHNLGGPTEHGYCLHAEAVSALQTAIHLAENR